MLEVARMRGVCEAEQEGGQCEYYDERSDVEPCTYPYEWGCPHLDDPAIICPGKDERSAETERIEQDLAWAGGDDLPEFVSLAQDPEGWGRDMAADPADQVPRSDYVLAPRDPQEQDADMAAVAPSQTYETAAPEWVEPEPDEAAPYEVPRSDYVLAPEPAPADPQPLDNNEVGPEPEAQDQDPNAIRVIQIPPRAKRKDAWSEDELWVVARATTLPDAIGAYRAAYPDSTRTDGAIKAHWRKLRGPDRETSPVTATPAPDFIGDVVSVTQCDEAAIRRPRFKAGDWVRISHPAFRGYTGTIRRYCAATANYLTHIDGTTDTMWLSEEYLEAA
jgi:hypothetical protein